MFYSLSLLWTGRSFMKIQPYEAGASQPTKDFFLQYCEIRIYIYKQALTDLANRLKCA